MTVGLTHNTDLWRVQIALSSLNSAVSSVLIERSANEILWSTVRGGTALPIVSGAGSLDDYEYLASGDGSLTTFYRVTTIDPPPGLLLDGDGDFASTPDDASLDITGDIELYAEIIPDDQTPAAEETILAKWQPTGDERSYKLSLLSSGLLRFAWSTDGTDGNLDSVDSSEAPAWPSSGRLAVGVTVDVDNGSSDADVTFVTATDISGSFVQLGTVRNPGGTISLNSGSGAATVGANADGSDEFAGTVDAAKIVSGLAGTEVANPDFAAEESGTASFEDDAGLTWTLQDDADIVTFETNSIAVTQTDLVIKSIRYPLLNRSVKLGDYGDLERPGQLGVFPVTGRSFPISTTDINSSVRFPMELVTETEDEARRIKLLLALGDILFLQSPAEVNTRRPPRSMYLVADSSAVGRIGTGTHRRHTVPLTEVAAPAADVTGGTLTWGNVFNMFGSWEQLISASPSWSDLLATVGDPDDLVVL